MLFFTRRTEMVNTQQGISMKLTNEQVEEIRASDLPQRLLAEIYGVRGNYAASIRSGRRRNPDHTYIAKKRKERRWLVVRDQCSVVRSQRSIHTQQEPQYETNQ